MSPWQPFWKRPRKPESESEWQKIKELREQRKRLKAAGVRLLDAGESSQPRCPNRISSAATRRSVPDGEGRPSALV
ncbi:hypothetical protein ACIQZB_42520 [Streptomyces sp. NPDC097727]|uniref:hypothetical protein n=1 Tax=Streptomyces sp. NPDC097727 TaxID=3366092 RepID=UPI0037F6BCAE